MITRINEFLSAPGKEDELHSFLKSLAPYITSSEGCISFEVLRSMSSPSSFAVIEKWADIDSHKKSLALFPKETMQSAMALFGGPPKGEYYSA
jgi:quinol monooxygenase YgiN